MNRNFIMEQVIKVKQISAAQIVKLVGLIIFLGVMPEDLFTKIFSISQRAGTPLFVWKILIYYCLFFVYLLVVFLHYRLAGKIISNFEGCGFFSVFVFLSELC